MTPSSRKRAQQIGQRALVGAAQARGRLVEDDHRRIGRERAGDFEDALAAERQIAGKAIRLGAEADALELPQRLGAGARLFGAVEPQRAGEKAGAGAQIGAEQHIVDQRHARAQLDVLKGAGDAGLRRCGAARRG